MLHKGLTGLNILSVFTGLIMSIVVASNVLGWNCDEKDCQSMLYITTTFLSTRRIETTLGWPVATERASSDAVQYPFTAGDVNKDRSYRFGHYLECMYTARMADKTCSPSLTFNDYAYCLTNTSAVVTALDQCASFPTVGGVYYHWPTPEEYLGCLWNNPLLQNSESRRASQNVFRACVDKSLWPFFEIPQGIDTPVFMGAYNWGLLLLTGFVVMTSFGVYQVSYQEEGAVTNGETGMYMRLGLLWSGISLLWNIAFFGVLLAVAFRGSGEFQKSGGLPTTSSTTFVTFLVLGAAVLYFLSIVIHPTVKSFYAMSTGDNSGIAKIVTRVGKEASSDHENQRLFLASTLPAVNPEGKKAASYKLLNVEQVARYYTPPLLAVWADSYFADFCIVMGIAGATGQLSTDQGWYLFTFTFLYRVLNMIISRCMSDAFMNNIRLDDEVNRVKNDIVTRPHMFYSNRAHWGSGYGSREGKVQGGISYHLNIKVIGLSTQLAALYLYVGLLYLVFNQNSALNDFNVFKSFFVLCFVIPEALRLLLHLGYQFMYEEGDGIPWVLYNASMLIWIWDYVFRIVYVSVVILENSNNPGTLNFLKTQTNALMRDYVPAMLF